MTNYTTLAHDLRQRINPAYATQIGTESYERRLCAEAIEDLLAINAELLKALQKIAANKGNGDHDGTIARTAITKAGGTA